MKPVDDSEVWSAVTCAYRRRGLQHRLLAAAIDFARHSRAALLEACPVGKPEPATTTSCSSGALIV